MSVDQFLLSADTTDLNYPEIRPTLDLNFARVKALDPRITFTRSSGGSYVGADGLIKLAGVNEARFDHDPETGESLGLLIEESRSNLLLRSEEFDNSYWAKSNVTVIPNATIAPDGTLSADKIVQNNLFSTFKFIARNPVGTINGNHTLSVFLKAGESYRGYIQLIGPETNATTFFDLGKGIITNTSGTTIRTITPYPNGWYRLSCGLSFNNESAVFYIVMQANTGASSYTGDGTSGFYVWGAQVEQGAFPTSYIPTQASTRTRARDTASIVGKNFSDFYNQIDSALFISGQTTVTPNVTKLFGGIVDTTKGFVSSIYFNYSGSSLTINWSPGITENLGIYNSNTLVKSILTYTSSEPTASSCRDGGRIFSNFNRSFSFSGTTQFGFPNTMNRLVIGSSPWGFDSVLNGTISRLTYFPKRLPNAQLQALTR
jgi:hypothetical protein